MHDIAYIVIHDAHIHYITLHNITIHYVSIHNITYFAYKFTHNIPYTSHHIESHHISALHQAPLAPEHRPGIVWHWGHVVFCIPGILWSPPCPLRPTCPSGKISVYQFRKKLHPLSPISVPLHFCKKPLRPSGTALFVEACSFQVVLSSSFLQRPSPGRG